MDRVCLVSFQIVDATKLFRRVGVGGVYWVLAARPQTTYMLGPADVRVRINARRCSYLQYCCPQWSSMCVAIRDTACYTAAKFTHHHAEIKPSSICAQRHVRTRTSRVRSSKISSVGAATENFLLGCRTKHIVVYTAGL